MATAPPNSYKSAEEPLETKSMQEFILFAKDMLSQKPSRQLIKVYLMGSAFAVLGTVIGLIEMVSHPFSSGEPMDAEMLLVMAKEQKTVASATQCKDKVPSKWEEQEQDMIQGMTFTKVCSQRSLSKRRHASRS
ncbi:G0/G1 switch protein 2-like [Hippocampus comes]|uniref:G0/G1 switch protein 2-like n=1 Tax=Hippocampus comes TaxID=109280 RepID=A0A3Q2YPC2_HIPCM|nr:PREDICTED: G0/G1 switch protein 2-like [Hippocampus comes]